MLILGTAHVVMFSLSTTFTVDQQCSGFINITVYISTFIICLSTLTTLNVLSCQVTKTTYNQVGSNSVVGFWIYVHNDDY